MLNGAGSVIASVTLSGCIQFEQQTVTYAHDAAQDTLRVYHTYSGIHGPGGEDAILDAQEQDQLVQVWTGRRTFLFDNWLMTLDLSSAPATTSAPEERVLYALLRDNMHMSNGPFYVDSAGRLCAAQRLTISRISAIVAAANSLAQAALTARANDQHVTESERIHTRQLAAGGPMITLEGNRITIRLLTMTSIDASTDSLWAELQRGGVVISPGERPTITIGRIDADRVSLSVDLAPRRHGPKAIDFVRERFGIAERFDQLGDADSFFQRHDDQ